VYLDEAQDLHFLNAPFDEATSESPKNSISSGVVF